MPKPGVATIYFDENPFWEADDASNAQFVATTVPHFARVYRTIGNMVWSIGDPQPLGFEFDKVDIVFDQIFPPVKEKKKDANTKKITVKVKNNALDGRYKYTILYNGATAQDPELDVKGDTPLPDDDGKGGKK